MITELNTIPLLTPAFNKNLLGVSSPNIVQEKYSYIVDVLLNEFYAQYLSDAYLGYPEYAGFVQIYGVQGADQFTVGDKVMVFDLTNGVYTGIHRIKSVPNQATLILDTVFQGFALFLGDCYVYKIKRNKLPANPEGNAIFNINSFGAGEIGLHYRVTDYGMFNIPENFERYKFLPHEEYYEPLGFDGISGFTGLGFTNVARVTNTTYQPEVNDVIVITQDSGTDYNGTWTVLGLVGVDSFIISASYIGTYNGEGVVNFLPKTVRTFEDFNNITEQRFAFNGALPYPEILQFNDVDYDATLTQPCKFLTTIPDNTKMRLNDKGYIQFFQSNKTTCTSYVIDVYDENGFLHQYIVNLAFLHVTDHMQGVSVGPQDLNTIYPSQFDSIPARGLPVIQECDKQYEVYLQGNLGCSAGGVQMLQFEHPLSTQQYAGSNMLVENWWTQQLYIQMYVQVNQFEIGGIPQLISPTQLGPFTKAGVTSQTWENIYADSVETMTGLNMLNPQEVDALVIFNILGQPHAISIDLDQDFLLKTRIIMTRQGKGKWEFLQSLTQVIYQICYEWDSTLCEWTYTVSEIPRNGFMGLQGGTGPTPTIELSEHKKFQMDWSCCTYTGARLIFEDRLGSMPGFNFTLKKFDKLNISSDAFEQDRFDINRDEQTRGFSTIQTSYDNQVTINSDYLTQAEYDYLTESMTNPNCFLQIETDVFPATIIPKSIKLLSKENDKLIRVSIEVKINGTNYSQRN